MKFTGAGGVFCAAHADKTTGNMHGHTWQVIAWFYMGEAEAVRDLLQGILKTIDHTTLPPELAWGEDLAEWIAGKLNENPNCPAPRSTPLCVRVQVNRPAEHIYAEWQIDPSAFME